VLPVRTVVGEPVPDPLLDAAVPVPGRVSGRRLG
jgi:hypothetical protein